MKKKIKLCIIAVISILFVVLASKTYASTSCEDVSEENIKYVNATLTKIKREEYNAEQRGMHWTDYYSLPMSQRYEIDKKSMLMASTEGMNIGGLQNGFMGLNKPWSSTGVLQGLVKDRLINDNIFVIDDYTNKDSFFPKTNTNPTIYSEVLSNWKFPFIKESNGYYSFNSDVYHVYKDYNTKTIKMHKGERSGFYPFNDCNDDTSISMKRDLGFTVRMDIPFIMTENGKVKNTETKEYEDMVFNFSGDDDVWVFVDDKLVLDLGGTHARLTGNINFAKNQVYYEKIYNKDKNQFESNVYETAFSEGMLTPGKHTLKIFYMERAGGESNLFVTFNLQSGGVQANYIDKYTGKKLDTVNQSGPVGEIINTEAKEFSDYILIEKPKTEEFILTEELQEVNYYYAKKAKVNVKYVDEITKKEIAQQETISGKYGDNYTTIQKKIDNYDFSKVEGNKEGTIDKENINVTYYYKHKSKVIVNYIDEDTNETIDTYNKIVHEGESFTSEKRQYEDYELTKTPEKETVKIAREDITLNYYYHKLKFNLQIEMNLEKALVNGNYYGLNGKIGKIETEIRDANKNSSLQVYYKIKVTNNQERIGSGYITFTIPEGYHILNTEWQVNENEAEYKVVDLDIGESREYEIILEKNEGVDIAGDIKAQVRIDSEKLQETTLDDNEDMNELVIMPRTGIMYFSIMPIIAVLTILAIIIYRKIKKNK